MLEDHHYNSLLFCDTLLLGPSLLDFKWKSNAYMKRKSVSRVRKKFSNLGFATNDLILPYLLDTHGDKKKHL